MSLRPLLQLLRPQQWPKNALVLIGPLLERALHQPGDWQSVLAAGIAFCLLSSAVYVFNDLLDREQDRLHPQKRLRPLACGSVSVVAALALMTLCLCAAFALVCVLAPQALVVYLAYLAINIAYTLGLKQVVILDVFIVATGFMLRFLAGMLAVNALPPPGLLLSAVMLFLFIGFCQRQAERNAMRIDATSGHRRVLQQYSPAFLDQTITLTATATVVTYGIYAVHAERLWPSVLCVAYGVLRKLYLMQMRATSSSGFDRHVFAAALLWLFLMQWAALP